jgi:hypothetical protein
MRSGPWGSVQPTPGAADLATWSRLLVELLVGLLGAVDAAVSALSVCAAINIWQAAGRWRPLGWSAVTGVVAVWAVVYVMRRRVSYYGVWATARRIAKAPLVLFKRARGRREYRERPPGLPILGILGSPG